MDEFNELLQKFEIPETNDEAHEDRPCILVIDDDASMRRSLKSAFSTIYAVDVADNGQEGIDRLHDLHHCVILDVKMKGLSGFDVYPRLKKKCPDVPILFFTAFQSEHDLQNIINTFKPEGYIEKGRDISLLAHLLENAVSRFRLVLENRRNKEELEKQVAERTRQLAQEKATILKAQQILSSYLAPQFTEKVLSGQIDTVAGYYRKKLTLLFSDIKDFTIQSDLMEPEDLAALLNDYFSNMIDIVHRYNGTLASIIGDALFVFFGAPEMTSEKDHAERCVFMAMAMQRRMRELQRSWFNAGVEYPLSIRIGINTGTVTVGCFGSDSRKEYTAMGSAVNLASRLEKHCEPDGILISHSTWALVNDSVDCRERGPFTPKGFQRPTLVYTVNLDEP